jgi:hypothetical protein
LHALKQLLSRLSPRQRKFALGGSAALALLGLVFGVLVRGEDAQAIASTLRSPMSIFASRSPGARLSGVLLQTKPNYATKARGRPRPIGTAPRERVLSTGRSRPIPQFGTAPVLNPPLGLSAIPTGFAAGPGIDAFPVGPGFDVPGFGFGDTPGFAGGPGGNPPGSNTPGGNVPGGNVPGTDNPLPNGPGSAVPESSTWLMMIVGLGAAGMALRRRAASTRAVSGRE